MKALQAELSELQQTSERLFEAVEKGILPLDELLQQHSRRLQTRRQEVPAEIASHKRRADMPAIGPRQVKLFRKACKRARYLAQVCAIFGTGLTGIRCK